MNTKNQVQRSGSRRSGGLQAKTYSTTGESLAETAFKSLVAPFKFPPLPYEYKVVALSESPASYEMQRCNAPDLAAKYWNEAITKHPYFNPECECLAVLMLNTAKRIKGHYLVSIGTGDTCLAHPREVFRLAVVTSSAGIILMHNHPSGDAFPSEGDIRVTRELVLAGRVLRIEVLDHVIMGRPGQVSLRSLGCLLGSPKEDWTARLEDWTARLSTLDKERLWGKKG